jgi:hypothetical protein
MIGFFFLLFTFGLLINIVWYSHCYGITPTATSRNVQKTLIEILPPLPSGQSILELGSGWGGLVFLLAHHFPSCKIIGYEISPVPYLLSKIRLMIRPQENVKILRKDFFSISLRDASLIVCYLYPEGMQKLKNKFSEELKPGAYIVSHTFAIPGWKPVKVLYANDLYKTPVFLYQR